VKFLSLIILSLFSSSLSASEFKLARDLNSSSGHKVIVGEFDIKGKKRTHVSISFENKVCIEDLITFFGPNGEVRLEWKSGTLLNIQVPSGVETKKEFKGDFLECSDQKVRVELGVYND